MEMPVSHSIYTEIQKKNSVWKIKRRCEGNHKYIMQVPKCKDHVHLSVAIPPKESISDFMGYLKGKSTLMIYDRHPELQSKWDKREMEY